MSEHQELSSVSDELFALLTETEDIQGFLDDFAALAARRLSTTIDVSCAITLVRQRKAGTLAASDAVARKADEFQNRFGDGPCLDAAATGVSVHCSDTTKDPRRPTYLGRLDTGRIRSILGVPIALEGDGQALAGAVSCPLPALHGKQFARREEGRYRGTGPVVGGHHCRLCRHQDF